VGGGKAMVYIKINSFWSPPALKIGSCLVQDKSCY